MHPPISQKIHWPLGHFNYTTQRMRNIGGGSALVNWKLQSPILPVFQGSASSSVVTSATSACIEAPLEKRKAYALLGLAAMIGTGTTAVAPFERVKLLMQNQNEMIKTGRLSQPYGGIFDCFARTIRNEGFFSLWRGNTAMVTANISSRVISLILKEYITSREHGQWKSYGQILAATGVFTLADMFVAYPFLYAGTRLANDVKPTSTLGTRQFSGVFDVLRKTLKSDGIAGLYRGFNITLAKFAMGTAVNSALMPWEQFCLFFVKKNNLGRVAVRSGFRVCRRLATYPLDTVSRRMMMRSGEAVKYKSSLNAFAQIFKTEGVKSFYKGAGAVILLNVASSGVQWLMIELLVILRSKRDKSGDGSQPGTTFTIRWKRPGGN
ncbi:hypothetical protein PTKIN_Ptkin01aG0116100 [Pterospermum kingtungense]